MSHTPGPWAVSFRRTSVEGVNVSFCVDAGAAINIAGGQSQEHLVGYGPILEAECRANAHLIAAAPKLLSEARSLVERLRGMAVHQSHYAGLENAIAQATQEA
jgi:hypothetical protein